MRALFLTNIPSPYQLKMAEEMAKHIDIEFWFTQDNKSVNRPAYWDKPLPANCRQFDRDRPIRHMFEVNREISKLNPEIVWLGGNWQLPGWLAAYQWARRKMRPVIAGPMERSFPGEAIKKKIARDALMRTIYRGIDAFLCPGFESYDHYKYLFPRSLTFMFSYAADCARYQEHPVRKAAKDVIFVTGGKMERQYRRPEVMRVFEKVCEKHKTAKMVITGWGSELEDVKKTIEQSNLLKERVSWWKVDSWEGIGDFYQAGHVFVIYASWGGWGLIVQETMASGMPVICGAEISAGRLLIKNGLNGFLVHDDEELYRAFCHYLDKTEDVEKQGDMNKKIARSESIPEKAPELVKIFEQVIREKGSRH